VGLRVRVCHPQTRPIGPGGSNFLPNPPHLMWIPFEFAGFGAPLPSRVLWAGEGMRGGRRNTAFGLPLLPLVVAGAEPIVGVGVGVRHRRGQGTALRTALRWDGVEGSGRGGMVIRGLHLLQE
jgi:hypothetical protein